MPDKNFKDDISVLSDDKKLFSRRPRTQSASRSRSTSRYRPQSSSQSVTSSSSSTMKSSRSRRGFFGKLRSGGFGQGPDDISVSDSLCSGVLRGEFQTGKTMGGSSTSAYSSNNSVGEAGRSFAYSASAVPTPPIPGGVADFNLNNFSRIPSNDQSIGQSLTSSGTGPSMTFAESIMQDEANRRENRKERVKEKLDRYKRDQKQLKHSCVALEHQLAQTTEKLKEVDSKAAFKIDSLESELRETRVGMEQVAKQSTREVTDQSECIKALGKKLIRQAHVIKRQKSAVEQYKVQLNALQEEMTMQDERDSGRADEYCQLKDRYDSVLEQKVNLQRILQENIEEMTDLKIEAERDAKSIMELEFNLNQKEAMLDRVAKEVSEKSIRICTLEEELEEKNLEVEDFRIILKDNETSVEQMKQELERAKGEVEEWMSKYAELETSNNVSPGGGGDDNANHMSSVTNPGLSASILGSWKRGWDDEGADPETFEAELQAKDATIQTLDDTVNEQEATIQSLKSNMVKIKSTYESDKYLKRKEIIKLTQANAEYALKYRGLEKAFKAISAPSGTNSMIGSTMHGAGASPTSRLNGSSMHGGLSRHGKSLHSVGSRGSIDSKEDKAAAVKARLGMAPYEFPSADQLRQKESQIVVDSNFFDGSDQDHSSEDGRKGEFPEEC
mmetsp:Transcript_259/g.452  ORF Transcript_259/g.452 Transcript_259/m.452 type:complete len:672 (-) Transcript_259:206-2221(-)|eukprot:CAMPEP_0201873822 /NCGR_PEP_ID=MMETSP0902-20130614/6215_1 /ASSEMBLY_ACC=CAM_ASM_000551 /TAXON_ID=420261 /ORGANISM="Thalassiosira antarctica, Strain CCMP982" /LENGTH=671 /DNA_ID=CAMNT_0048400507 /DNA_START=85 /DNA_END=2100 /DNA_ORIENTATION=+